MRDERCGRETGRGGGRSRGPWTASGAAGAAAAAALCLLLSGAPGVGALAAQEGPDDGPDARLGGLLRTGLRVGPDDLGRNDGFELYDVRLRSSGKIGIVFEYFVQGEFDDATDDLRLLDARLRLPIVPELALELGQFKAPFGREALQGKGDITFVERSQITQIVAPGRQVGVQLSGEALDGRLRYAGGVFNGNGRTLDNDDDDFLYAARASFNTVGGAAFPDELVIQVGASFAYSRDSAAALAGLAEERPRRLTTRDFRIDLGDFQGERTLWGVDLEARLRGFFLRGEYLRGDFEPEGVFIADPGSRIVLPRQEVAQGGYLEGGYDLWGAIEGVVRWDGMNDFLAGVDRVAVNSNPGDDAHFLVFGLNLFPGFHTKVGLQYSVGLGGTLRGPGVADDEFALTAQVDF